MSTTKSTALVERIGNPQPVSADVMLPAFNEEERLDANVRLLLDFFTEYESQRTDFSWNIVIVDKSSTDSTWSIATALTEEFPNRVRALRLTEQGHGGALKIAWGESLAQVVSYMDVGLSTDIKDAGFLIGSLLAGGADISIGSRLLSESQVERSFKREFISRTYNLMLRSYLDASFHDTQCGFKAMTAEAARTLLPLVCSDGLFFDTELLLLAQDAGMLIYEIPVAWTEPIAKDFSIPDAVRIHLDGMRRMKRTFAKGLTLSGVELPWKVDAVEHDDLEQSGEEEEVERAQNLEMEIAQLEKSLLQHQSLESWPWSQSQSQALSQPQPQSEQPQQHSAPSQPLAEPLQSHTTLVDVATVRFSAR